MLRFSLLLLFVLVGVPHARAADVDDPEVLANLAVERQPGLDALAAQTDAMRAVATTARLWMDPMLGAELSNLPITTPILGAHAMSGLQFKLQQTFPAPGEIRSRTATAEARVLASERDWDAAANALRGEVRARYQDLAVLRQLEAVTRAHLADLDRLIGAVDARYRVGSADQHDLLQLALRRDRLGEFLADFSAKQEMVLASINGALARDPATPITTPELSALVPLPQDAAARQEALGSHPDLERLRSMAAVARAEAEQARFEANPEPTVWLGYRVRTEVPNGDPGTNFVTAGVSVPLPFASTKKYRALAQAAEARARAADESVASRQARLLSMLAAAEAQYARAAQRAGTYRTLLEPAARAALDSTSSAYQVDRAAFADLVRAEVDLLDVQRARLLAESEAASARADILTLLGPSAAPDGDDR